MSPRKNRLIGKALFVTEQGSLGVQWWKGRVLQDGDVIVLTLRSVAPLILRPDSMPRENKQSEYYKMMGIACIDGLIDSFEPN